MSELFDVFFLNFPVDSFSTLKVQTKLPFDTANFLITRIQNAVFEVVDYEFSNLPGNRSNIFVNKENHLCFPLFTRFRNRWNFVNIYRRFQDPLVKLLKIIMKIRYQEAYQKAGLLFAIQSHI